MQMEQMYQEIILDHYKHPQGKGLADDFDAEVHHINPTCGDEITLRVSLTDTDNGPKVHVSYDGQGCSISQASASVLATQLQDTDVATGMAAVDEFVTLMQSGSAPYEPDEEILGDGVAFAGVAKYPARVKCALLAWMAWKDAVAQALAADVEEVDR
jgi:nitrogen fixation protein NifU and related proteins